MTAVTARVAAAGIADVVLDCRWLDFWGAGRFTELLLRGLAEDPPSGAWVLWGPRRVEQLAWPGARVVVSDRDPRAWNGQRACFETPRGRVVVFLHQQRPLRTGSAVVVIHDTIQLRHGGTAPGRLLRAAYLRCSAARAGRVVTISEYSRQCIQRDLSVPADRIAVVPLPLDLAFADRVAKAREDAAVEDVARYVGRFAPHKNLDRLLAAFGRTRFRLGGGRLELIGGRGAEVDGLIRRLGPEERSFTTVRPWCDAAELESLVARARFVVQPSLEEGYGLPVVEAMASGVTVCVSDGGALPEVTRGMVRTFPARSVDAMVAALDQAAEHGGDRAREWRIADSIRAEAPSLREFARQFRTVIDESLGRC